MSSLQRPACAPNFAYLVAQHREPFRWISLLGALLLVAAPTAAWAQSADSTAAPPDSLTLLPDSLQRLDSLASPPPVVASPQQTAPQQASQGGGLSAPITYTARDTLIIRFN